MNDSKHFQVNVSYPDGSLIELPLMNGMEIAVYFREIMEETREAPLQDDERVVRVWGVEENSYIMSLIYSGGRWRFDASNLFPENFFQ